MEITLKLMLFMLLLALVAWGGNGLAGNVFYVNNESLKYSSIDIVDYIFDDRLDSVGGKDVFRPRSFDTTTGKLNVDLSKVDARFVSVRKDANTVLLTATNTVNNELITTSTVSIAEDRIVVFSPTLSEQPNADGLTTVMPRFVNVGDIFSIEMGLNSGEVETCVLEERFGTLDLTQETAPFDVATGVLNDVLRTRCTLTSENGDVISVIDDYYAYGSGVVFQRLLKPESLFAVMER